MIGAGDPWALQRFDDAQAPVIDAVRAELAAGRKRTHWMWFVFPQLAGLGRSPMAQHYAIASADEARAYLAHPLLGARLAECAALMLGTPTANVRDVLGPLLETALRRSLIMSDGSMAIFARRPVSAVFIGCAALFLLIPLVVRKRIGAGLGSDE